MRNIVNLKSLLILMLVVFSGLTLGQQKTEVRTGTVSYISSQNAYVKFESTDGISTGDTIFVRSDGKLLPALVVKFKSSRSVSGTLFSGIKLQKGSSVFAVIKPEETKIVEEPVRDKIFKAATSDSETTAGLKEDERRFSGRVGISSYSGFSNRPSSDYQRWRYLFSYDAENLFAKGLDAEGYFIFRYRADEWQQVKSNIGKALKVYSFSFKYDLSEKSSLLFGRNINRKISNIGAIDGLQYEHRFGSGSIGAILGSRPNFGDYGINFKLFQAGVYYSRKDEIGTGETENSIALVNQTNNFKTDRRFIYLQHSNSLIKRLSLFASSELELYKVENGTAKSTLDLTSIFVSARFSPVSALSLSASYDARKNVIYFETYKNLAETILQNEIRQGLRFRASIRPIKYVFLSATTGYRFKKGDPKPSNNYGFTATHSRIPLLNGSLSLNYNGINSNYVRGKFIQGRLSKDLFNGLIYLTAGYKRVLYNFVTSSTELKQNIFNSDVSLKLFDKSYINFSYEGVFEEVNSYSRFFVNVTQRF